MRTTINDRRVDFTFDRETHLPVRISFFKTIDKKTYIDVQHFSDYVEVGGIKVPQSVKLGDGSEERSVVQFNVDYDPDIFVRPPPPGLGEKAWQPKGSK